MRLLFQRSPNANENRLHFIRQDGSYTTFTGRLSTIDDAIRKHYADAPLRQTVGGPITNIEYAWENALAIKVSDLEGVPA